jgi:hypothetical protein
MHIKEYKISSLPITVLDNFGKHTTFENSEKLKYHKFKKGVKSQNILAMFETVITCVQR